ncbi:MAG: hypothetical protein JW982_15085 [Spirochaetes bacterium]|nr:hypothetical protein [Spirochaetota bacterium]
MIDEIRHMIELQKYWDNVVRAEKEIESAENEIKKSEKEIEIKKSGFNELKTRIKNLKSAVNRNEVLLLELAGKENDLAEKSNSAQNEKQMNAFNSEIETIRKNKNTIEEETFTQMSDLENLNSESADLESKMPQEIADIEKHVLMMTERIERFKEIAEKNRKAVDDNSDLLSGQVKSKFLKLLNSSNRKAIVVIEKNACGGCRNVLPVNDVNDLGDNKKLISCQNCGKFLYREN